MHTCCSPVESEEEAGTGAPGSDTLLAASVLDLRASVGLGREGGLGKEGASGAKPFTALAAAPAAASNIWQQLVYDLQCGVP